jgi:diguanylate cyclase (GGDEF)-like protein
MALVLMTLLGLFYAYEVDIFDKTNDGGSVHVDKLEMNELLLVSALFCGGLVVFATRRWVELRREVARRRAVEDEIRILAFQDPLTSLPNRRQFFDALRVGCKALPRIGASHAVLSLDLNGFKRVNDVFGHGVGDEVLAQVGARLSAAVREGDLVARLGGDEFAILSTQLASAQAATGLAQRVIDQMRAPIRVGHIDHSLGVGIGIALVPQDGTDPTDIMRKADVALYRAKKAGASTACFFEPSMDRTIHERDWLERELRFSVDARQIKPYFQPLVSLPSGVVRGYEALARWVGRDYTHFGPERFIPTAENMGLIGELTDLVLEEACATAVTWPDHLTLSFNVSPLLLRDPEFAQRVLATLVRTGLPGRRLELEITESALVRDMDAARATLGGLRDAGIRIALDDFGTGYSSLYHLRNFPIDRLKIDRSFVSSMVENRESAAIVRALVGLGEGLGIEVTAEGVETSAQERMLREQGCGEVQGYLFGHALSRSELEAWLENADTNLHEAARS